MTTTLSLPLRAVIPRRAAAVLLAAGAVFTLGPALRAQTMPAVTPLYNFSGSNTNGASPVAGLIQGKDGNLYGTAGFGGASATGTVFQITPAGVLTTLHKFTALNATKENTDGANPDAGLVQGSDGNFYGTTLEGGSGGAGTVFRVTAAGAFTLLHTFTDNSTDGGFPAAGLVQGRDGNLYGTTAYGGASGAGTVFRITTAGVPTSLHAFADSSTDGGYPLAGLILGSDGNFYGTTSAGGSNNVGTVFRLTPAGVLTTLHSFGAVNDENENADGAQPEAGVVQGTDGSFYGTTTLAGGSGKGTVFRLTPAGALTVLHSFTGSSTDGATPLAGLVQGSDGSFYGTTSAGGSSDNGTIFRTTAAGVHTTLHNFTNNGTDGILPEAGLVQGSNGTFYGTTRNGGGGGAGLIYKFDVAPTITSATTATAPLGKAFSYQIKATGNPTSFGAQGLPGGLTLNTSTGLISGTPKAAGKFTVTLSASNSSGQGSATLTLSVVTAPVITSATSATAAAGAAFSYQITASNSPASYGESNLPTGLTINQTTGKISGTPKTAGTYTVTIAAFNAAGSGSAKLTLTVKPGIAKPVITSSLNPPSRQGVAFSYQITATNSPTKYGESGIPAGLTINQTTGKISGTPTKAGTYKVTIAAFNSAGSGSATLTLVVKPPA